MCGCVCVYLKKKKKMRRGEVIEFVENREERERKKKGANVKLIK